LKKTKQKEVISMKKSSAIIIGAVAMLVTTLLYLFLGNDFYELLMFWISFAVVLVLELIAALLFSMSEGKPRQIAAAVGVLFGVVITVLVSNWFVVVMPDSYGLYGASLALIFGAVIVEIVILVGHDAVLEQKQASLESSRMYFENCRNVVFALINSPQGRPYLNELTSLEEELRYADDTKFTELDGGIKDMLTTLSNGLQNPGYDPAAILADLKDLIRQRQRLLHH
jgi:hypothetical protein